MSKIKLFKKYSDGDIRSIEANDTKDNVMTLFSHGYFLTEAEAKAGKMKEEAKKPVARKPRASKSKGK